MVIMLTVAFVSVFTALQAPQKPPPLPYESPGVCPFECCMYRTWTVEKDTRVLDVRRDSARRGEP